MSSQQRSDRLDSTETYDPSLGSWRAGAALPSPMEGPRAANIDNRVLIFGIKILLAFYKSYVKAKYLQVVMVEEIATQSWSMTSLATPTQR